VARTGERAQRPAPAAAVAGAGAGHSVPVHCAVAAVAAVGGAWKILLATS